MAGTGDYEGTPQERSTVTHVWSGSSWDSVVPFLYQSKKRAREAFCKITPPEGVNWVKIVPQAIS